jgi:hypothetical protein
MKILLQTHSSNPDWNDDCDYAVIDLTQELAKTILKRQEMANKLIEQDDFANEITFRDSGGIDFYSYSDAIDEITAKNSSADLWECGDAELGGNPRETEYETMLISCPISKDRPAVFGVRWTCNPRHSGVDITTGEIPLGIVQEIAEGKKFNPCQLFKN